MKETHFTFCLYKVESFVDGKKLVPIYNGMPLVSVMAMKGYDWGRDV
jgi:hypothetical protein